MISIYRYTAIGLREARGQGQGGQGVARGAEVGGVHRASRKGKEAYFLLCINVARGAAATPPDHLRTRKKLCYCA